MLACGLLTLGTGCDQPSQPAPILPASEPAPRSLPGTYQLGPDNLMLDAPAPETPVVWVDLLTSGSDVTCRPWRPDEQEVSCEMAAWIGGELKLNLVRRYQIDREEIVERWYFRGTVTDLEADRRELVGNLVIEYEPHMRPMSYRVRARRVEIDEDDLTSLSEHWTQVAQKRELEALRQTGRKTNEEAPLPDPYGSHQLAAPGASPQAPAPGQDPDRGKKQ